ncbi:MAG: pyridoxamine 5'-phosphate oxidase family protein [Cyanobacterium sp. T60_A2020_053]|nr:pyridoxamine 5'-phosphate oxidase family protein [Cyanobacterium sp. T60_A2020_053]
MTNILPPWRAPVARALHRNRAQPFSRYLQLATVTPEGMPTNRTVVFRSFYGDSNYLQIITDIRSEKYEHLKSNPYGEICWYFCKTREQFRLTGKIDIVTAKTENIEWQKARKLMWQNISDNAKVQFYWETPKDSYREESTDNEYEINKELPNDNFCLLLFAVEKVDHLELRGEPQNRYLYSLENNSQWQVIRVNP